MELNFCVCMMKVFFKLNSQGNEKFELYSQRIYYFPNIGNETLFSGGSRPGHKVSGTRSKFPNLHEMDKNLIFCEVSLTQNPVNILSRSATAVCR